MHDVCYLSALETLNSKYMSTDSYIYYDVNFDFVKKLMLNYSGTRPLSLQKNVSDLRSIVKNLPLWTPTGGSALLTAWTRSRAPIQSSKPGTDVTNTG